MILGLFVLSGSSLTTQTIPVQEILDQLNHDRAYYGLPSLHLDPTLNLAALAKAQDMIQNDYFAHTSPAGLAPWHWFRTLGYEYSYAGENLAKGYVDAQDLESSLMASSLHRANILSSDYSQVGIATITINKTTVVVELFGSRLERLSLRQ